MSGTTIIMNRFIFYIPYRDITLKMLIDDRYCGHIIGRDGKAIKKIREETNTRITISK